MMRPGTTGLGLLDPEIMQRSAQTVSLIDHLILAIISDFGTPGQDRALSAHTEK